MLFPHFVVSCSVSCPRLAFALCNRCSTSQLIFSVFLELVFGLNFSNNTRSLISKNTLSMQSAGTGLQWSKMIVFSRIAILNLELGIILFRTRCLDFVSNGCDNALSEESCHHHRVPFHLDFHQKDSEVWRRLLALFCRLLFHPESTHNLCERCTLSSFRK